MKRKANVRKQQLEKLGIFDRYELNETDKKVIQYRLRFTDITQNEIAQLCSISDNMVSLILQKPSVKLILKEFEGDWIEMLINAKEKAAKKLIKLIDEKNPSIALRACENILQLDKIDITKTGEELAPY